MAHSTEIHPYEVLLRWGTDGTFLGAHYKDCVRVADDETDEVIAETIIHAKPLKGDDFTAQIGQALVDAGKAIEVKDQEIADLTAASATLETELATIQQQFSNQGTGFETQANKFVEQIAVRDQEIELLTLSNQKIEAGSAELAKTIQAKDVEIAELTKAKRGLEEQLAG